MRVLLDTNILIHRDAATVICNDIGELFLWLDRIGAEKCIHPASIGELQGHQEHRVVQSFAIKIQSYHQLLTTAPDSRAITVTHPSGNRQAHYQISYPDVPRISNEVFSLNALKIVRLDGAAEEKSWDIAP